MYFCMKFKAILFDLDGTLLDSVPVILKTAHDVCHKMGLPLTSQGFQRTQVNLTQESSADWELWYWLALQRLLCIDGG